LLTLCMTLRVEYLVRPIEIFNNMHVWYRAQTGLTLKFGKNHLSVRFSIYDLLIIQ